MGYWFEFCGFKITGKTKKIYLLIPFVCILAYLFACGVLYSIVELTGFLKFSWMNGLYALIILMVLFGLSSRGE